MTIPRPLEQNEFLKIANSNQIALGANRACEANHFYFFYHIPKCGGMDFYLSLSTAINKTCGLKNIPATCGRCDDEPYFSQIEKSIKGNQALAKPDALGVFASHLGKPLFESLFPNTTNHRKICFIREPFQRALSEYSYLQMRAKAPATEEGFNDFYMRKENQDKICNSLLPGEKDINKLFAFAEQFYIFTTVNRLNDMLGHLLCIHGLSNVIRNPINATMDKYRLDGIQHNQEIQRAFYDVNPMDRALYGYFAANPVEPSITVNHQASSISVMLNAVQEETALRSIQYVMSTKKLCEHLRTVGNTLSIDEFIARYKEREGLSA